MRCNVNIELVISNIYLLIYKRESSNLSRNTLIFLFVIFFIVIIILLVSNVVTSRI